MTTSPDLALRRAERALEIPRARLAAAVLSACATLAAAFALAAVSAYLVTRAWTMPPVLDLTVAVVMVRALGVARGVFRWLDRMTTHAVALRGVVSLRTNLFTALAARTDDTLARLRRGDLLARIGDDAQELADHVIKAIVPGIVSVVMFVVVLATIMPMSMLAGLTMAASLVLASLIAPLAAYRASRISQDAVVTTRSQVSASALEILDDATSLRVDGRLDAALGTLAAEQSAHDAAIDRAALPSAVASAAVPASMVLAVLGSLLAAGSAWLDGGASAGQIGVLLLLPLSSFEAASALPAAASQYARSRAAAARLDAVVRPDAALASPEARTESAASTGLPADNEPAVAPSAAVPSLAPTAHLRAVGLTAGWSPEAPRVAGLDLDLPPGSRLAVVGASGSGKSTLLATLAGLLSPLAGTVQLDGTDIASLPPHAVRQKVVMFAEDAHVFATSVRENLRVVRGDLDDDTTHAALRAVGLEDWVAQLPRGLDTMLGPDGTTVSGGERRRLLLARAVIRANGILLLDEPTEHLDPARGDALLRSLLTPADDTLVPSGTTVVVVTHRAEAIPPATPVLHIGPGARAELHAARTARPTRSGSASQEDR
ncbi:thiol reductant ABC exporter subunit CydC [Brachybacterium sp. p3-SID957]|uniref:thiol reductant ABC exporter subunit CydC n=1 Tax=Brachybacterium sp. p3-SID957 TaxID=2916049 RepID=UPI0021E4D58F|nr:thiol reductant ABC exporter subunit CydC [Brachybacterium sp. p3-SID957]MCT1775164.1 thiol reductant ABC exporter subunit CydC [Brachybacterium sp. p3-SID957]